MVANNYSTRLSEAFAVSSADINKSWSLGQGRNKLDITISRPLIRTLNKSDVFTVDILLSREGVILFHDRVNFVNPPLGYIDSNGLFVQDAIRALKDSVLDSINALTNKLTIPHNKFLSPNKFAGDTLAVRSSTADGRVTSDATTSWDTVRNGNSLAASSTNSSELIRVSDLGPGTEYDLSQGFFDFDTSSLGANVNISNGVFTFYGEGTAEVNTNSYDMQVRPYNWGGTVTTADWIDVNPSTGWTNLTLMAHLAVTSWVQTAGTANNFTVDSYADISKTGVTYVVLGLSGLGSASAPTGTNSVLVRMANTAGTTSDPLLTVTYTPVTSLILRRIPAKRSQHRR